MTTLNILQQQCTVCEKQLPLSMFHINRSVKSGYRSSCKPCVRATQQKHAQALQSRETYALPSSATCTGCGLVKEITQFYIKKSSRKGYASQCKTCQEKYWETDDYKQKHSERAKQWYKTPRGKRVWLNSYYRRHFGITIEEYERLLSEQNSRCGICETEKCATGKSFAVDHDHTTGRVRGLLCKKCNLALGFLEDDTSRMQRAINYMRKR